MAMDKSRITAAAVETLKSKGFDLEAVPFQQTGKSAAEIMVDAIADAVVNEIRTYGVVTTTVSTTVAAGIVVQVAPVTGTGATAGPGSGSGTGSGGIS